MNFKAYMSGIHTRKFKLQSLNDNVKANTLWAPIVCSKIQASSSRFFFSGGPLMHTSHLHERRFIRKVTM